jgi:hypothetical protein
MVVRVLLVVFLAGFAVSVQADSQLKSEDFIYSLSAGGSFDQIKVLLDGGDQPAAETTDWSISPFLGFGAHIPFAQKHELGMMAHYSNADDESLLVLRVADYRYQLWGPLRLKMFFGFARYDQATPAHGYFLGSGLEWRFSGESLALSFEGAYGDKIARDRVLPSDPPATNTPEIFYDIYALNTYLSWYF